VAWRNGKKLFFGELNCLRVCLISPINESHEFTQVRLVYLRESLSAANHFFGFELASAYTYICSHIEKIEEIYRPGGSTYIGLE
jgi:hypothetical protein